MNWDKVIDRIKENYTHPISLLLGVLLIWVAVIPLNGLLKELVPDVKIRFILYASLNVIWFIIWLILRHYVPKNKKGNLGIVIAIRSESQKQKIRLKNDFTRTLKALIAENNMNDLINIIYMSDSHSKKLISVIQNAKIKPKKWVKLRNKVKAHLYIHGDIKERKEGQNKYFLAINSTVVHYPLDQQRKSRMLRGIDQVWVKNYVIPENIEFSGFELSAKFTFIGVRFIIGLAAFLSGDVELALKLHKNLYDELNNDSTYRNLPPIIKNNVKYSLSEECQVLARYFYQHKGDFRKSEQFLNKSFNYSSINYGGLLLLAIIQFIHHNDPKKALATIERAKAYSKGDGTWKYSKGFLLMHQEKFKEAYRVYESIVRNKFDYEIYRAAEAIDFNKSVLVSNPKHLQSYFIIGILYLEKINNPPLALEIFEKFLLEAKGKKKYKYLYDKTELLLKETKEILGLP